MSRYLEALAAAALVLALAGGAHAQSESSSPGGGGSTTTTPSKPVTQEDLPPPAPGTGGIQGQNIFDVKPEVKRDASSDPGYMQQNNGQRNAVQPHNNAPMWRGVQAGHEGYTSLPKSEAPEAGILIQGPVKYPGSYYTTAGQAWREVRNKYIVPYGAALLGIVVLALAIFYFTKGPVGESGPDSPGRKIERFTPFERAAHWSNAIAFCCLAISGIVMAWGKFFLQPVIGLTLFGYLTYVLKNLHNFMGPLFVVSLVIIFITFVRDNFPQKGDLRWVFTLGGAIGKKDAPSHRFNAGEKGVFWIGVFALGIIVVASGLVMDRLVPNVDYVRGTMQVTHMVHATAATLMIAVFLGHIYMGTVGMRGAYTAMRRGYVTESWAREHHAYWLEDIESGKVQAQRSHPPGTPPEAVPPRTVHPA
ncbi:formate dehydrogenase subunit gamma [Ramlibacter sp. G-1-2-2]|uniref:Formate dehydrogenase subunit gamma n=1 Tax=Ramlibacter agri TaxID=2728837 RepID=A0A848GYT0_9BURK|nr:formate dehydrogenase subunit gamma [Ramlibacter agri]NML43856.1 formate dehydrogenase subunit gamma [Ramlibacter agri]